MTADRPTQQRVLALDASTPRVSVALGLWDETRQAGPEDAPRTRIQAERELAAGAAASAGLVPALEAVLREMGWTWRDVDLWVMGRGPGAFTGLRTAAAVIQGLAQGVQALRSREREVAHPRKTVLPMDTLLAVAESARHLLVSGGQCVDEPLQIWACLDARMGEWYVASYQYPCSQVPEAVCTAPPTLVTPDLWWAQQPATQKMKTVYAGPVFEADLPRHPLRPEGLHCVAAWPTGGALLRLMPHAMASTGPVEPQLAQPMYVRNQVALTTAERQVLQRSPAEAASAC